MVGEISLGLGIEVLKTSRLQAPVVSCAQLTVQPLAVVWPGFNGMDPGAL